jgi:hypothetical protein
MPDFDWEALKEPVTITIDLAGLRPAKAGWALAGAIETADSEGSWHVAHVLRSIGKALVELDESRQVPAASAPMPDPDDELSRLARAATAGEWSGSAPTTPLSYLLLAGGRSLAWISFFGNDEAQAASAAAYITAVSPARVLALQAECATAWEQAGQDRATLNEVWLDRDRLRRNLNRVRRVARYYREMARHHDAARARAAAARVVALKGGREDER